MNHLKRGTSKNPKLCVTLHRQNAHLLQVNSAFLPPLKGAGGCNTSVASLDFGVFRSPQRITWIAICALLFFSTIIRASAVVETAMSTQQSPSYAIKASALASFGSLRTPYVPTSQTVTITNIGTGAITLVQPTSGYCDIGKLSTTALPDSGATATFTIQPKVDLWPVNFNVSIDITGSRNVRTSVKADFTVVVDYGKTVMQTWSQNKDYVFKLAKEQDKFLLLFFGHTGCAYCEGTSDKFANPGYPFKKIIADQFIAWFCDHSTISYARDYWDDFANVLSLKNPQISLINPDMPGKNFSFLWGWHSVEALKQFLNVDLLANSNLKWLSNKDKAIASGKEQEKLIFKFVGRGSSPNSHKMIKLLNEASLKKLLEKNYCLWYSDVDQENYRDTLPYISIFNAESPNHIIEEIKGVQDEETIEEILSRYTVSNVSIPTENQVSVWSNVLQISNQIMNEQITIFTSSGQHVTSVLKNANAVRINTSNFPKGVLIIHSSTGWSTKIIIN